MQPNIPGTPWELRLLATAHHLGVTIDEATRRLRGAELEAIAKVLRDHDVPATGEHVRELVTDAWRTAAAHALAWQGLTGWHLREQDRVVFRLSDQPLAGEWKLVGAGGAWADLIGSAWPYPPLPYLRVHWLRQSDWSSGEPGWSDVYLHRR